MLSLHEQQLQRIIWSMIQPLHEKLDQVQRRLIQLDADLQGLRERLPISATLPPPILPPTVSPPIFSQHVPGSAAQDSDEDQVANDQPVPGPGPGPVDEPVMPSFRDHRGYPKIIITNYIEEQAVTPEFVARCLKRQTYSGELELFVEVYLKGRPEQEIFEIIRYENGHYYYNSRDKMIRSSNADEMIYRLLSSVQETYRHCFNNYIAKQEHDYFTANFTSINQYIDSIMERSHMERFLGIMRPYITIEPEATPPRREKPLRPRHK